MPAKTRSNAFAIGADQDVAVKTAIAQIPDSAWAPWRGAEIAETVHSMNQTHKALSRIVIRRPRMATWSTPPSRVTATTLSPAIAKAALARRWNGMPSAAATGENRIKELKLGFGMEQMPCGHRTANAVFFRLGILAYNLFQGFKQ